VRTREGLEAPDIQLYGSPTLLLEEDLGPGHAPSVTYGASLLKPPSRGHVALVLPDPTAKPFIVHNYFAEPEDLRGQVAGTRLCMEIAASERLADCLTAAEWTTHLPRRRIGTLEIDALARRATVADGRRARLPTAQEARPRGCAAPNRQRTGRRLPPVGRPARGRAGDGCHSAVA
jgi:choline dehydrogenase-like flavoprotein